MISQTVEYALRAAVYLAAESPAARTTEQIAKATRVPAAYLSKVLQSLARAKIVASRRGIGGGMTLAKDPAAPLDSRSCRRGGADPAHPPLSAGAGRSRRATLSASQPARRGARLVRAGVRRYDAGRNPRRAD